MSSRRNTGFTAIELLVVISVMLLLGTMTTIGVVRSMRQAVFNKAVASVQEMATQARLLAIACNDPGAHYGVRLGRDPQTQRLAAMVVRHPPTDGAEDLGDGSGVVGRLARQLPPIVDVWAGDGSEVEPLADDAVVTWFYASGSGFPVVREGAGFSAPGVAIGVPKPSLEVAGGGGIPVFGVKPGTQAPVRHPTEAGTPGLSVRTRDQRMRVAIAIYSTGVCASGPF